MKNLGHKPRVFRILREEAMEIQHSPFGRVGKLVGGEGVEAVWAKKEGEEIDPLGLLSLRSISFSS
jgi:hypothetical protein